MKLTSENVKHNPAEGVVFPQGVRFGVTICQLALDQAQAGCVIDAQRTRAGLCRPRPATGVAGRMASAYAGARRG